MQTSIVKLSTSEAIPAYPTIKDTRQGWLKYGDNNLFPQEVINLVTRSPVQSAIIDSAVVYICGKAMSTENGFIGSPNVKESWHNLLEKAARDYKTFGGFYFQIIVNKDSKTVSVFHQDFSKVRITELDERGEPTEFGISNDWKRANVGKYRPVLLDTWQGMEQAEIGKAYLFYYWNYSAGLDRYCIPEYFAAFEYIKADGGLGTYYNNSIDSGFNPSAVISMPSNPEQSEKDAIVEEIEDAYAGTKGASRIIFLWGENSGVKPEVSSFDASKNADIYNNIEGIIFQKIISANRLSSPTLAGISGTGNLSGNAAEIIDAYILYNYTVIEKMRGKLLEALNLFTKINKTGKLEVEDLEVLDRIKEVNAPVVTPAPSDTAPPAETVTAIPTKLKTQNFIESLFSKFLALWNYN